MHGINGIPASYDYINAYNGHINPSTVHCKNTALQLYFEKYLMEEVFSVFDFTLPDTWDLSFFRYCMFDLGFVGVLETDKYGVIFQNCTLKGRGIYYQPTNIIVANPLLNSVLDPMIHVDCELIKLQPNYQGIHDLVSYYATMMALCAETSGINMLNSRLAYIFLADGRGSAESFKKLFDEIASGNPAVYARKELFTENGDTKVQMLNQHLKETYIASDVLADIHKWKNLFCTDVGIPNANFEKSSRLITDEVNANNDSTKSKALLWVETMKDGMERANKMFGLNLDVKLRFNYETTAEEIEEDTGKGEMEIVN